MQIIRKKLENKISLSFIISISLHLLICSALFNKKVATEVFSTVEKISSKKLVDLTKFKNVRVISAKELNQIKRQMVFTAQNGKKVKPVQSRFQGESDQTFEKQTMASNLGNTKDAGLGKKNGSSEFTTDKNKNHNQNSKLEKLSLSTIGAINVNTDLNPKQVAQSNDSLGSENGSLAERGLASSTDFVENIPLGEVSNLNTTENKYYGFYHRIKLKLEQHWGSTIRDRARRLYKKGGRIPASDSLITSLTIVLSDKGQIIDIKIEGTSGIRELDQAAVESFNKAGPFPNPPKGLLVDGRAVIQWGFVVKS